LLTATEVRRAARAKQQREEMVAAMVSPDDPYAHVDGAKASHGHRQAEFARWLVTEFGLDALRSAQGVVDVAGGRAGLCFHLHGVHEVPCTLIEPRGPPLLRSAQRRLLRKRPHLPPMRHVQAFLGMDGSLVYEGASTSSTPSETDASASASAAFDAALLAGCSALVGMHCDEATEPLVRRAPTVHTVPSLPHHSVPSAH
jgi:hypothetical protein